MDIPRTESSSSYLFHHKSSSPIGIPGRHHSDPSTPSTSKRSSSPDLIFEMEPFSPLDRPSTNYPVGLSTSCTTDDREPLLYPFPMLSAGHPNADRGALPTPQSVADSSFLPPITHKAPPKLNRCTQPVQLKSQRQSPPSLDPTHPIRVVPIHKIIGFKPDFAVHAPEPPPIKKTPREKPLAPPPRSSTLSSPAWIRPRRDNASDDEPRSLDLDSSAVDFTQHLLRRIDSQKPLQFHAFQMSLSVR
ncbi:hypothetical protein DFH07DRAFT_336118 [Mycena maculata]|uniref:Uncharacterized protein n=1 Tax=Mycena maculata TaxID=230809 RepID=A0AAD7MHS2_9AGAR|nr:hypothetical protein DFH07DRAFT_336118 [Mycena maculata]